MRKKKSVSRALWCVAKGRASEPEAIALRIGVSTSMKSCAQHRSRTARITSLRRFSVVRDIGLAQRSASRWR